MQLFNVARAGGRLLRNIAVDVDVLPFALPDNLNFIVDLNAYSGVNSGFITQVILAFGCASRIAATAGKV